MKKTVADYLAMGMDEKTDPTVDSSVVWNNRIDFCRDVCYLNSTPV